MLHPQRPARKSTGFDNASQMKAKSSARKLPWEQLYARELLAQFRKTSPELVKNISLFPPALWDKLR